MFLLMGLCLMSLLGVSVQGSFCYLGSLFRRRSFYRNSLYVGGFGPGESVSAGSLVWGRGDSLACRDLCPEDLCLGVTVD